MVLALVMFACSKPKKDDAAAHSAKEYYDSLKAGNSAFFVRGAYMADSIPDDYREQLEANAKMLMARIDEDHKGIKQVRVANCVNDTIEGVGGRQDIRIADAFLMLSFGDSTKEEIVVPMILHKGKWMMR